MKNSILLLSCIFESTVSTHVFACIFDFKRLWNASHIYACTHPKPKIYGCGRKVHLRHFPRPKRPWPKCPGRNVLGRNVRGRNVRAPDRIPSLIWVQIVWKGYQQMTMSGKGLTQSFNISVQLQLGIASKVSNSLDPDQVRTEFRVWSGSKLFERVISRWQCHVKV